MNNLKNSVRLIGYLGKDPQIKEVNSGKKMARFSLATHDSYKDEEGITVINTQWHHIVAWDRHAKIVEDNLKKGTEIALEGKLITRTYPDQDGSKRYITEVVVNEIMILGAKSKKMEKEE